MDGEAIGCLESLRVCQKNVKPCALFPSLAIVIHTCHIRFLRRRRDYAHNDAVAFEIGSYCFTGALLVTLPTAASAQQPRHRVIVIQRVPVVDPFFPYAYPYPPNYLDANYGYVKIDTHRKDASVYVDGGYADKI